MSLPRRLIVRHLVAEGVPRFVVTRGVDGRDADPVSVASPSGFEVAGSPGCELMGELAWYLEKFLDYPFAPRTERAERVRGALRAWGRQAFQALFSGGRARDFYRDAVHEGLGGLCLEVRSDDPRILAWPWEALEDAESSILALGCQIERRLSRLADPPPLSDGLPKDRVNILLVIARPYAADVGYRSIARPLVEAIQGKEVSAEVTVLRPPTFARLQEVLAARPGEFHILHFDGHGGYGTHAPGAPAPDTLQGPVGRLVFETDEGTPDPVDSERLGTLLREHRLPAVVLNACRSGMVHQQAEDAFASVAAALLKGGVRSVVAMAYALYVSGAKHFLPAFYGGLLERGDIGEAARAGRRKMYEKPGRVCAVGTYDLADWLVPVVYQQERLDLAFAKTHSKAMADTPALPEAARDSGNPYGFIGRDSAILELERAMHRKPAGILIQGLGGVGKTTLARGFLKWLAETGGLGRGAFWIAFNEVHSAEFVVDQFVVKIFGAKALAASLEKKVAAVTHTLRNEPFVVVWDNFESARGIEGAGVSGLLPGEDLECLKRLLGHLRGGRTKVILTSRSDEDWLGAANRYRLRLSGLHGEERWEFCRQILQDLGRSPNPKDSDLADLMETLGGHPLLMRAVLPRLETMSAAAILVAVEGNLSALDAGEDALHAHVMATLRFVEDTLPADVRPLLAPLALHERFVAVDDLNAMAKGVLVEGSPRRFDALMETLGVAGLVTRRGNGIHELHPALTGFLRARTNGETVTAAWERAFVDRMARIADHFAPKQLHEQQGAFAVHEENFHHARARAERLDMGVPFAALTRALAMFALNTRSFADAARLYQDLAAHCEKQGNEDEAAVSYHQLGIVAQERRDLDAAERWYLKSLEICEKQGNEQSAASSYHQLGTVAQARRHVDAAERWYLKSLAIKEKQGNEHAAASSYHHLGMLAQERRDFDAAERWYLKSLAIKEKQGNEHAAASSYHHLGMLAQERRDFDAAERWYLKSLAIKEKQGDEQGAAASYHHLGIVAQERRHFDAAERWYHKSLAIKEKHGNEHGAASSYLHLGIVAHERGHLDAAESWHLKSLAIKEKQGNEHGAATSYHQLGIVAQGRRDFDTADRWYLKSLAIKEKQGDEHGAANSYLQLGIVAQERRDLDAAERWHHKSLAIREKHGNEHGAASSYYHLGTVAQERRDFDAAATWFIRSVLGLLRQQDPHTAHFATRKFLLLCAQASEDVRSALREKWRLAGLPELPSDAR
ncbi:MAG: tetratricopeptide repeat protein [Myxococcota bacterium]